jgi:hypothetical protein
MIVSVQAGKEKKIIKENYIHHVFVATDCYNYIFIPVISK